MEYHTMSDEALAELFDSHSSTELEAIREEQQALIASARRVFMAAGLALNRHVQGREIEDKLTDLDRQKAELETQRVNLGLGGN